jgi:hypothetical protein
VTTDEIVTEAGRRCRSVNGRLVSRVSSSEDSDLHLVVWVDLDFPCVGHWAVNARFSRSYLLSGPKQHE